MGMLELREEGLTGMQDSIFHTYYQNSADAMLLLDAQGVVDCNPAALMLMRCTKTDVLRMRLEQFLPPASTAGGLDAPMHLQDTRNRMTAHDSFSFEWPYCRPDGSEFTAEVSVTPVPYQDDVVMLAVCRDVSQRVQTELALKRSEMLYRTLFNSQQDGVFLIQDAKIVAVNAISTEMTGFNQEEMVGQPFAQFIAPEDRAVVTENYHKRLAGEAAAEEYMIHLLRKDGATRVAVNLRSQSTQYEGQPAIIGMVRNMTERLRIEAELHETEQRFRSVIESSPVGMQFYQLEADDTLRLVSANPGADQELKFEHAAIIGLPIEDAFPNLVGSELPAIFRRLAKEGGVWRSDMMTYTDRNVMGDYDVVAFQTSPNQMVATFNDITFRRNAQAQRDTQMQDALARRAHQVQVSTEIAQAIAAASILPELFDLLVRLVKERFGYYHTQLLRYDAGDQALTLVNGYGEVGQRMVVEYHQMALGQGIIGVAAASGQTVLRADVQRDPTWQPNPLLPDTRGEIAVPIKFGERLLGVLDVQSDRPGALDEDDRLILEGLCGQIAIAIDATILRQQMESNLSEMDVLSRMTTQKGWKEFRQAGDQPAGFLFDRAAIHPVEALWVDEIAQAVHEQRVAPASSPSSAAVAPLAVRGEVIGALGIYDDPNHPLTEQDLQLIEQVSDQVSQALESARLYNSAQRELVERRRLEDSLIEERGQLADALDAAHIHNWEFDFLQGLCVFNDRVFEYYGTTAEAEGGYTMTPEVFVQNYIHPESAAIIGRSIQDAAATTDPNYRFEGEAKTILKNGEVRDIILRFQIEKDAEGRTVRLIGANQDVTERRRLEDALLEERGQLADALDAAHIHNWEFDFLQGLCVFNDRVFEYYGTTAEAEGGYTMTPEVFVQNYIHPESAAIIGRSIQDAAATTDPNYRFEGEAKTILKNGEVRDIILRFQIEKDAEGRTVRLIGANQDVTEQRRAQATIAKRAAELATVSRVSTTVATILNPDEMLQTVVDLTKTSFELYHAHIYLFNEDNNQLVLAKGASEIGRQMTAEGRQIGLDSERSLVARSGRSRQGVIVNDVRQDPEFLPHPLLPETRSEMAVPLVVGDTLLGVMDVQSEIVNRFSQEDVSILTTLAAQVAVSLQNARSYARAQRQAEREAMINTISERIQSTSSVEDALQVAVRELGRALGAQHTSIRLGLERKGSNS